MDFCLSFSERTVGIFVSGISFFIEIHMFNQRGYCSKEQKGFVSLISSQSPGQSVSVSGQEFVIVGTLFFLVAARSEDRPSAAFFVLDPGTV